MHSVSSTILALRSVEGRVAVMACDGQATMDSRVVETGGRKVHRIHGGTADGTTLLQRLEGKLASLGALRQAVELSREWRIDRALRRLEVVVTVCKEVLFLLTGQGDVIEPDDGLVGIGSDGGYAVSTARALLRHAAYRLRFGPDSESGTLGFRLARTAP